jgi:hypothetical protein
MRMRPGRPSLQQRRRLRAVPRGATGALCFLSPVIGQRQLSGAEAKLACKLAPRRMINMPNLRARHLNAP